MSKEMINVALRAAIDNELDVSDAIKKDVFVHLRATLLSDENVESGATRLQETIKTLAEQFEKMPLSQVQIATYLFEVLDLPRDNLEDSVVTGLLEVAKQGDESDSVAIVEDAVDFNKLPVTGINRKFDNEGVVTQTAVHIKLSQTKMMLFVLSTGIQSYSVTVSGDKLLVEFKPDYTVDELGKRLEANTVPEYAPALMSDRETVEIDVTAEQLEEFASKLPKEDLTQSAEHILKLSVDNYAKGQGHDLSDKRVELTNYDDLVAKVNELFLENSKEAESEEETVNPTVSNEIENVEIIEEVPAEDQSLFSEGVAEQTEETVAPEAIDDIFDDVTDEVKDTLTVTGEIIDSLVNDPDRVIRLLSNSNTTIKATLLREVLNTLPTIEKRASDSYNDNEKEEVSELVIKRINEIYATVQKRRDEMEAERIANIKYTSDMVYDIIKASPVHGKLVGDRSKHIQLASILSEHLNNNEIPGNTANPEKIIKDTLLSLSLYNYELESLINPLYRTTNVPTPDKLISGTPVISTVLRQLYEHTTGWTGDNEVKVSGVLSTFFDKDVNLLDMSSEDVELFVNYKLTSMNPGEYGRVNKTVIVYPFANNNDKYGTVIAMSPSEARVLTIDKESNKVIGLRTINKPIERIDVLNILLAK